MCEQSKSFDDWLDIILESDRPKKPIPRLMKQIRDFPRKIRTVLALRKMLKDPEFHEWLNTSRS